MTAVASVLAHREVPVTRVLPPAQVQQAAASRIGWVARWRRRASDAGSLAAVPVGTSAVVVGVGRDLEPASARRLVDLGFAPGATVEVLRRAPMADPTIFRVADTEIALRRTHAASILVAALDS